MSDQLKQLHWVGSSKKDLLAMPSDVVDVFGFALHLAQSGKKHDQAKPLKGFGAERVKDFATPCFINLRCKVVLFQSASFVLAVS